MRDHTSLHRQLSIVTVVIVTAALIATTSWAERAARRGGGRAAPVHASERSLHAVHDCDGLRTAVSEAIVEQLVSALYGWWGGPWREDPWAGGAPGVDGAGPSDYSSTNVQEEGVDELDLVKTDGEQVLVAQDHQLAIVDSWPPSLSSLSSTVELDGWAHGLFLHHSSKAVVVSQLWGEVIADRHWGGTRVEIVDLSDPTSPVVSRTLDLEGYLTGARKIGNRIYLVVYSALPMPEAAWELISNPELGLPELPWDAPDVERDAAAEIARRILRPHVERIVAGMAIAELVPLMRDQHAGQPEAQLEPMVACGDLYRPADGASPSVLTVVTLDLSAPSIPAWTLETVGLLADGWTVYASTRSLYVAQTSLWWWAGWGDLDMSTTIHKFELDETSDEPVRYAATGEVPGWLLNQFSMSEHANHLRVATTRWDWWWGTGSGDEEQGSVLSVLRDNQRGRLEVVGQIDQIAPGEQIYSARFLGERGFLVTFEQIDPLFTFDLADPTAPRLLGELKVTGYSAYLHPVGDDFLLAVGMDGDDDGNLTGLAASLFDVSDLADPQRAHHFRIAGDAEHWSWSEALYDHHAFTFHRDVLSIPASGTSADGWFSGIVVMQVDVDDGISELGRISHADLPAVNGGWVRRSVVIEDALYSISSAGIKVNALHDPAVLLAVVPFPQPGENP